MLGLSTLHAELNKAINTATLAIYDDLENYVYNYIFANSYYEPNLTARTEHFYLVAATRMCVGTDALTYYIIGSSSQKNISLHTQVHSKYRTGRKSGEWFVIENSPKGFYRFGHSFTTNPNPLS
jgi:hypothetical protein